NLYNQALQQRQREELQLYVNRQKELASSQASAPLQAQVTELTKLNAGLKKLADDEQQQITSLHEQMKTDATTALQAKDAAHTQGMQQGAGFGVGASLVLFGVIYVIRKLMGNFTVTKKEQARAASA